MKKKKQAVLGTVLSIALVSLVGCSNSGDTVATFDGGEITKDALYDEMVSSNGADTLKILVRNEITKKEAEKLKVTVTNEELDNSLAEFKTQYGSEEAFKQALETYNVSEADIKKDMKADLLLENILKKQIKVTDDEMKSYFEENKDQFNKGEQVKASHILVKTEDEAKAIVKQLNEGADFAKLAKEKSTDSSSAIEGGDLGFFGKGQMVESFEKAAFSLEIGKISEPVKSEHGFHIIKVTEKKKAEAAKFEDNKEAINEALIKQKMQETYSAWLDEKFKEYKVELKLK